MQILQRNDVSAQAVAAMGSQFVVENGMVPLEHSQPLVFRPFVHRMPPTRVIGVPDATVLLNEDAMVENLSPKLMPLKVVLQGNGSAQAFGTEVLDANSVAYEDFAGLLGEHRSASGAFSDSSVAASEKSDPSYRTSAAPVDSSSRRVKLMCSFGGRILPRPSDGKLRYVGGETRILSVSRHITYADLLLKLSETYGESLSLKYQLPDEDIESLISVCSDEDLENMMEEFDRLDAGESSSKLRVFLFSAADHDPLHLNDTADRRNSEQKYVDAVNSVGGVCLRNSAEFNSSHDLIGLHLSDVKTSGLPEPETLLTPVTATEVDLQTVAVGMPVPPKLYSGKTLTLSAIPTSSFVAPQPSPVNYQYVTLKTELSHQDLELADSASSSAASHPDLFYQFPGMLEADSLGRMVHIDSHSRMGQIHSSGGVFSSQEQQKELTMHLDDPLPGMPISRMDFHQSHLQAQPQTDFIQTSWQHPADEHLTRPTSSVSGNVQKQAFQHEQQASTLYTPAAHEAMFYKHMDQQQQQEEVLAGLLPSQVASGPIFQIGSPPSSPHIGLVQNINKKFGNMQHMQGYLDFNGGFVDEEHGGILYHKNKETGRVFHPLNPYLAHVEQAVPTEEQAAPQLQVVNMENRQKQIFNLAHGNYQPSHVPSKPTVSPYLVVGSYYDGIRHCQDGTIEDQILLEEQQSQPFPISDSNQDFVLQPDRQPFFCYFNDRQGNTDLAFQHRENDSHETKLCTGLQLHEEQMDLKENESVANLAFNSYVEFPSGNFPAPNLPEGSTSLPDFAATSVGHDLIESTPFHLRAALYPKGDAEQALVFDPVVVSEGLPAAQLNRRPEMDSLLVHTKPNTVTLALDVVKDSSISIPASNDSTCVPMSRRSFVTSNDNTNVSKGQRLSTEKLPDSKLSQLPLQISSLVAGTGLNASESFFSAENQTQLTEDFHFNAAEAEVRQQSLLRRGPANEEFSMYKSSLYGNASNRMDPSEGLSLHHSTSTKSLIDDASGVLPYSDHHSSNSGVGTSVSYPELLATLANGFDSSLVNAAIAASPVTSFLSEAVTNNTLSPSVDLLRVSTHSQPSINFTVEDGQDQVKEGAKIALKSEFRGLNYTSLDVPKKLENTDSLSSLTSLEEQYNHVKDQSSSFAQLHIHDLENQPKRSSSEHTRESVSAAFVQPTLYSAPTLSIQNWEKSLTEAEVEEQDVAADLSEERLSETVKTNAVREKEVTFEEIKMGTEEEDMHEYKIYQPNNLAAIAEAEAISRGLQIIKNADLEELRELGAGTFGTVYHGKWRGTDVAIKRIKSSCFAGRPSERERLVADFWREAWILSQLHHPNVVAFYGVVPDGPGGTLATVTEFMVNGSLKQVLQRKDRTIDRRKRLLIAMDAAFGMEYLHGKNIVHFDLKCENLLVNMRDPQRSICKVGDLGLSKIKHQTLVSGGVRGTLPWMAPELLNGSSSLVSEKVDVFSFGIVMWELLTGEEPYANMHYGAIIGGIVNNTLRPSVPNWCDPAWKSLMERCWSSEPNERPSFPEIAGELRAMAASLHARGQTQAQGKTSPGATAGM